MTVKRNPNVEKGFTLIELLVVIGIFGILAGLLIPAVLYAKFKARTATCTNNYRQLVLAAAMYATVDSKGRLPSFELPTESSQLESFRSLYPWINGLPLLKALEPHGITQPQMWFCPMRQNKTHTPSKAFQAHFGRPMATMDDYTLYFTDLQSSKYAFIESNWWVPRRLEGSSTLTYPDVSLLPTRLDTPWPSKLDDATLSTRPIISDWMVGDKSPSGDGFAWASGAHVYGGKIRNCNSGYADGHVETRSANNIKWELRFTDNKNSAYIFY